VGCVWAEISVGAGYWEVLYRAGGSVGEGAAGNQGGVGHERVWYAEERGSMNEGEEIKGDERTKDFHAIMLDDDLHVQFTNNETSCIFIIHTWYAYRSRYYFLPTP